MEFNKNWQEYILYDIANWKNGLAFKNINFSDKGKPIIKIAELKNGITEQTKYTEGDYGEEVYLKKNDLIFSWSGNPKTSIDAFLYDLPEGYLNQHSFKVTEKKEYVTKYFLYYILKYLNPMFQSIASDKQTTGLGHVTISDLKRIKVRLPNIEVQNKFLCIIKNIDDKIYNNNQINDNLHKLLKNIYYNKFIDNKNEDWIVDKLGNYLDVERGLSYKGKFLADDGTPMINLGNVMPDGVFRLEKNKYYTGEYKEKVTATAGDIVMANTDMTQNREVIGTPVIIPHIYNDKVIFSHHIYGLKNLRLPKMYVFYSLLTDEWNGIAGGSATGTTVLALPKYAVEEYMITIPDEVSLKRFEDLAQNIQNKREEIIVENLNLEQLRDTLLPKLMNGEIDINKVEI